MPIHNDHADALHKATRRLGFFYRKSKASHSRQQLAPVAEALRALQQRTFPTQADNLQSACAKAPSETKGLFGFLAALAGADRHGLSEATLATPALEEDAREEEQAPEELAGDSAGTLQQELATLPLRKSTPEQKQKETQTEPAAGSETATQTEPTTQTEDARTDDEAKLQEELATNNADADSKSAKKRKKKKAAKELNAQTLLATASASTQTGEDTAPKKRVTFKTVSVYPCAGLGEGDYYPVKSPANFSDEDSADEDQIARLHRYGRNWRNVVGRELATRGVPLDIYIDLYANPWTHAYVTAHRKERWLNRAERLGTVEP